MGIRSCTRPLSALLVVAMAAPAFAAEQAPAEVRRAAMPEGYLEVDGIAAVVGKKIVTISELVRAQAQGTSSQQMVPTQTERPRNERDALRQTLDTLIDNLLIAEAAQSLGLTVSDGEIDAHLAELRRRNVWDLEELREAIRRLGFADMKAYREHVRQEKLRIAAIRAKLGSRLRVTDDEVDKVLLADYDGGKSEDEIRSRHILIKVPGGASPLQLAELRRKAWKIHDLIKAGKKKFEDAAEEYSDDMGTQYGGDLGYMRRWMLDQTFANTLWKLDKDEISQVVQTPFGFHIVQLLDRRRVPIKDIKILKQFIRAQLTETAFVRLYKVWMQELRAATHVEIRI
ncbi:MAG: PpiC-type peptidyl-prolyl cis-trans isomerase [Pseudomonadota bacterium]|jgi:peptidyl-prolyl cis-trans isomerase SurA